MKKLFVLLILAALLLAGCKDKPAPATETKAPTRAPRPTYTIPQAEFTVQQALQIAFDHAGYTEEQVTNPEYELDMDDAVPHYEIDFRVGNLEYEYKIHAQTGEILSHSCEIDN